MADYEDIDLRESIKEFNIKLLASQEPLGEEFTKILFDNLWSLLNRS